jgi:hypothetical protein
LLAWNALNSIIARLSRGSIEVTSVEVVDAGRDGSGSSWSASLLGWLMAPAGWAGFLPAGASFGRRVARGAGTSVEGVGAGAGGALGGGVSPRPWWAELVSL